LGQKIQFKISDMSRFSRKPWKSIRRRVYAGILLSGGVWYLVADPFSYLRPDNVDNICAIFEARPGWYKAARESEARWGTPKHVQMSIMQHESSFIFNARPPRVRLMGFIPWKRPSNAYGFAQALDGTWSRYLKETGNETASRDDFDDAIDFVGWYTNMSNRTAGISKWDPYNQYLAYHEGQSGWAGNTFEQKAWLKESAQRVDKRSRRWWAQLQNCEEDLNAPWWQLVRQQ
jgi:hypothetical protein